MMNRVYIPVAKKEDEVFIFYENTDKKTLEWFTLPDNKTGRKSKATAATIQPIIFYTQLVRRLNGGFNVDSFIYNVNIYLYL